MTSMCGTLTVSRTNLNGGCPSIGCLQEPPEDSQLFQEEKMPFPGSELPILDFSSDDSKNDSVHSPSPISSSESFDNDLDGLHLPEIDLHPKQQTSDFNSYLQSLMDEQRHIKAKERRMRRMQILRMKRRNGLISFDVKPLRYESKRRR